MFRNADIHIETRTGGKVLKIGTHTAEEKHAVKHVDTGVDRGDDTRVKKWNLKEI